MKNTVMLNASSLSNVFGSFPGFARLSFWQAQQVV